MVDSDAKKSPNANGRRGPLLALRLVFSALFIWGLYALFNGGAATVIEELDRRVPRRAPSPSSAFARARLAAPFILEWTDLWGVRLEVAAAAVHGDDPMGAPAFFVLGVTPPEMESATGIFAGPPPWPSRKSGGTNWGPNWAYVDLTFLEDVSIRVKVAAGLAPLYLLSSAVGLVRADRFPDSLKGAKDGDDLRTALYGDWLAGAALRLGGEGTFPTFSEEEIAQVVRAARASEEALLLTRPLSWSNPRTFRLGSEEQRTRWFLRGYSGAREDDAMGASEKIWSLPLGDL